MVLALEREWSLIDLRKTQRRVSALLIDDQSERQKYPLRRKVLPKFYCYVCSRIDPSGIFRTPNSYLFRQGFFHACEHFPKAPYTTFIGEEIDVNIKDHDVGNDEDDVTTDVETNNSRKHSISVTIRRGSSVSKFESPLRREQTFESSRSTDKYGSHRPSASHSMQEHPSRKESRSNEKVRLPSVFTNKHALSSVTDKSHLFSGSQSRPSYSDDKPNDTISELLGRHINLKDQSSSKDESLQTPMQNASDRVTVIPTGALEEQSLKSDQRSRITGLSTMSKGPTLSKSSNDLEPSSAHITKVRITKASKDVANLEGVIQTQKYINDTDGLDLAITVDPLIREVIDLEMTQPPGFRRPHAGRFRAMDVRVRAKDPQDGSDDRPDSGKHKARVNRKAHDGNMVDDRPDSSKHLSKCEDSRVTRWERVDDRPDSGHLRYHHRGDEDSVPHPGFDMPPTPSALERLELERLEQERLADERRAIELQIAEGDVFDTDASSKGIADNSSTDDASIHLTGSASRSKSKMSARHLSGAKSFCKCLSDLREKSFTKTTCKVCGKQLPYGSGKHVRESSWGSRGRNGGVAPPGSSCSHSSKSRQRLLPDNRPRESKTDEDYMDLESIIHEDDGHYWSSDDENGSKSFMTESSSLLRYRNAKPYPLVDPNLHKIVYLKALREAQMKGKHRNDDEFDEVDKIRRPNVFSYYPLLQYAGKGEPDSIGLRAEEGAQIKKGQFMKHIFGDVKLDDFYPAAGTTAPQAKAVINDGDATQMAKTKEALKAKKPRRKLPEIPKMKDQATDEQMEQPSVGLKMMKDTQN